jgi:hypothetical protein
LGLFINKIRAKAAFSRPQNLGEISLPKTVFSAKDRAGTGAKVQFKLIYPSFSKLHSSPGLVIIYIIKENRFSSP